MKNKNLMKKIGCMVLVLLIFSISHVFAEPCGDVNSDGSIDIVDALLIAQYYVGLDPANFDAAAADVNGDGSIDILDALLVAQYYVGLITELPGCAETPTPTPEGGTTTYELQAEDESWSTGGVESDHSGYTGTGYVNTDNASGEWIEWSFDLSADSTAECEFRYACESDTRSMDLSISTTQNPLSVIGNLEFPASGAWTTWATQAGGTVNLSAGLVVIRLTATASGGAPNMDKMDITITGGVIVAPTATPEPTPTPVPTETPEGWTDPPIEKPRIIATTDGETDDRSTMVRFLYYACDYDIVGIVAVNSRYQEDGHGRGWIDDKIDDYEEVRPNLLVHNPNYPTADYLRNRVYIGNQNEDDLYTDPPDMDVQDTDGSQFIIDSLLDDDPRPIHVPSWGGANTTAFALYRLQQSYSQEDYLKATSKIRVYCIWYQDGGGQWIEDNIREAFIFEAFGWDNTWDYGSTGSTNPSEQRAYMTNSWLSENVTNNHGPLGAGYGQSYVSEGDTPSFLHLINNGLRTNEDYTYGGWGGRGEYPDPSNKPNYITDSGVNDDGSNKKHYWRWIIPTQNDWEARMDWGMASSFGGANHAPVAGLAGDYAIVPGGFGQSVAPGETVTLSGTATDPDGNNLSYRWWQYYEVDSVSAQVSINNSTSSNADFVVPDESGEQIHIILEVTDDGSPPLVGYQRIIFDIQ
jgi:hypothetical protein